MESHMSIELLILFECNYLLVFAYLRSIPKSELTICFFGPNLMFSLQSLHIKGLLKDLLPVDYWRLEVLLKVLV